MTKIKSDVKMRTALTEARRLGASQEQIAAAVVTAAKPVVTRCECFRTSGRGGFPSRIQCGRKALPGTSRCRAHA